MIFKHSLCLFWSQWDFIACTPLHHVIFVIEVKMSTWRCLEEDRRVQIFLFQDLEQLRRFQDSTRGPFFLSLALFLSLTLSKKHSRTTEHHSCEPDSTGSSIQTGLATVVLALNYFTMNCTAHSNTTIPTRLCGAVF